MKIVKEYFGYLKYKKIDFSFIFREGRLQLIPPKNMKKQVSDWIFITLPNGMKTIGSSKLVEDSYFIGDSSTGERIIFIPKKNSFIDQDGYILTFNIDSCFILRNEEKISRINLYSEVLDFIFLIIPPFRTHL